MRIWLATLGDRTRNGQPGEIIAVGKQGLDVQTGDGVLRIKELQMPGKRAMSVQDFLNANSIAAGEILG